MKKLNASGWVVKPLALALFLAGSSAYAVPPEHQVTELPALSPDAQHQVASKRVQAFFTRYHFSKATLDDELSAQIRERYLEMLDYNKMFLLEADVQSSKEYAKLFDDMISTGDLTIAYNIHETALQRRFERYVYALSLLDSEQPFDFSQADDKYYYDREDASWAKSKAELDEIWRQRVKYDALNLTMAGKDWPETVETLAQRYNSALNRLTQTNSEDVFQTVMNAFARSVEAHTSYLSPANAERFQQNMNLELEGIGAVLQADYDYTVIRSLVPGGPADKNGEIKPEDRIIGVAQEDEETYTDVVGWRLDDVVDLIKGPKGSTVRLQVLKSSQGSGGTPVEVSIVRDKVKLEDRAAKAEIKTLDSGPYQDRKMGVINIPGFYNNLTADVVKLIGEMQSEGAEGLVIDLRGNGGGSLAEAITLTGLFIDQGPVVQVVDASGRAEVNGDRDGRTYYDGPLTVLVDRYSASASEIFAAALQDYGRAVIVGENTFGKGTVQQHRGLQRRFDFFSEPMGSVQYTVAKFYRINGGSTQLEGVKPDVQLPEFVDPDEFGEASEDNALPWDQIQPANFVMVDQGVPEQYQQLQQRVDERIQTNPEFQYVLEDIATYQEQRDKTWISLVLAEREAEEEAQREQRLARINERLARVGREPIEDLDNIPEDMPEFDPYLNETIFIAFNLMDKNKLAMQ